MKHPCKNVQDIQEYHLKIKFTDESYTPGSNAVASRVYIPEVRNLDSGSQSLVLTKLLDMMWTYYSK